MKIAEQTKVTYSYNGKPLNTVSDILLKTENQMGTTQESNGIETEIVEVTANNEELKDGQEIFEGQPVKVTVNITNNTQSDLHNLEFTAEHTNAVFYVQKEKEAERTDNPENPEIMAFTEKDENVEKIIKNLETLEKGKTATFVYEFSPKKKDETRSITGKIIIKAEELEAQETPTITNKIKDAEIGMDIFNTSDENRKLAKGVEFPVCLIVKNYSNKELKDITVNIYSNDIITPEQDENGNYYCDVRY